MKRFKLKTASENEKDKLKIKLQALEKINLNSCS